MGGIDLSEALKPVPGYELWDYFAYLLIFLSLIAIIMAGEDTSTITTIFIGLTLIVAIADKTYILGYFLEPEGTPQLVRVQTHLGFFGIMVARAVACALLLITVAQTEIKRVRLVCVPLFILMLIYTLGRWWTQAGNNIMDTPMGTWQ
jgi:hypothetical protein